MKIHAMCLVKNEADVIEECLRAAAVWADGIYVWDNGSTDGTWEIVRRLAEELPAVVAWRRLATETFSDGLRQQIFAAFEDRATDDDWWVRLDADEFYVQDPQVFLATVPARYGVVWYASLSYYFSSAAAQEYLEHPERFADDVPVAQRCRYYFNHWSEIRFVRHAALRGWEPSTGGWPWDLSGRAESCPVRIVAKHYAYRSPQQIERRIATRARSALSGAVFPHEAYANWAAVVDPAAIRAHRTADVALVTRADELETGWRSRVIPVESLQLDAHDNRFVLNEDLMPPIPGRPLPWFHPRPLAGRLARALRLR